METKTEPKEKKEVITFSYLLKKKVKLLPVKRPNSWRQKFKVERNGSEITDSGFMFANAKSWITVPLDKRTGLLVSVLDNVTKNKTIEYPTVELTEQEFFEKQLGLSPGDLDSNRQIQLPNGKRESISYFKGVNGAVCLKNEAIELDLSRPDDMLKYKILASHFKTLVAPTLADQNRKSGYRYVIMDVDQIVKEETSRLKLEMEASEAFNSIKTDIQKMLEVIWMKESKISESTNIDFVSTECYKIAKNTPAEFLAIMKSPLKDVKLTLLKAVKKGVIVKGKDQAYLLRDGLSIGTMEDALKWLKNPENFDRVELIKDQTKLSS
jgi:hypothetical protein